MAKGISGQDEGSNMVDEAINSMASTPVAIYPKAHVKELEAQARYAREDLHTGKLPIYSTADEAINSPLTAHSVE